MKFLLLIAFAVLSLLLVISGQVGIDDRQVPTDI